MVLELLTSAFLTRAVGLADAVVSEVSISEIGTGQMARSLRLALSWTPPGAGPATVVAKVAATAPGSRRTGMLMRAYEIEASFYTDLAPALSVSTPACYFARSGTNPDDYCVILEDLSSYVPGDQIAGCSVEDAAVALDQLARLHAETASMDLLAMPWLARRDRYGHELGRLVAALVPRFVRRYGSRIDGASIDLICRFSSRVADFGSGAETPLTALHGDFRADNLMHSGREVAVLDWQTVSLGPAVADVSYFLGGSMVPEIRRSAEYDLVRHYHDCVNRYGLCIGWEACWSDYRRFSYAGVVMAVVAGTLVAQTERDEQMFALLASRSSRQVVDLDAVI